MLFFLWLDLFSVGCGRYSESMVTRGGEICKTFQVELFYGVVGVCRPGKRVDDGVGTGGLVVSICNPSCCSALNVFYCFYIVCRVWVPNSGQVLQDWVDKSFICCFFGFLVSDF